MGGAPAEVKDHLPSSSKPLKAKTTKAERRALQEAQRAAKISAKGTITHKKNERGTKTLLFYRADYLEMRSLLHCPSVFKELEELDHELLFYKYICYKLVKN